MNKTAKIICGILGGILLFFVGMMFCFGYTKQYITTDIADYGIYKGNYDNKSVQTFVTAFFPDEIESAFSNVQYSYRAQKGDSYAYEAYLSFTIEDKVYYDAFIEKHTDTMVKGVFRYDKTYEEYTLFDELMPTCQDSESRNIAIEFAKIGKILCCPEKQEIIFVALGVYDGGGAETDFLSVYFNRFQIDPREYALHAIPAYIK